MRCWGAVFAAARPAASTPRRVDKLDEADPAALLAASAASSTTLSLAQCHAFTTNERL